MKKTLLIATIVLSITFRIIAPITSNNTKPFGAEITIGINSDAGDNNPYIRRD